MSHLPHLPHLPHVPLAPLGGGVILDPSPAAEYKKNTKSRGWIFTLNNWTEEEYATIKDFVLKKTDFYIIGKEVGESGTPHLQGYFYKKDKIRFGQLKVLCNRWSLKMARGSPEHNLTYCSKDGDFITNIQKKKTPDEFIKETEQKILHNEYADVVWKPWQQEILNIIETKPDNRTIHWYYETKGNTGKSFLTKYIALKYNVIIADGKKADIFNQVNMMMREQQQIPAVIILDVPRRNQGYVSYGVLEQLKNGMIYSGKYEGGRCIFESPHVIVFSNSLPDTSEMSADRWHIVNIDEETDKAFAALGLM